MTFSSCFPAGFTLETNRVLMRPMQPADTENLFAISQTPELWKYFTRELHHKNQLQQWVEKAIEELEAGTRMPFTVIDKHTGTVCGSTSYANISFYDRRIEIGNTWLGAPFLGSGINTHCKFALLQYAFDTLQFERVEIKTDNLNERVKNAIRKIGGQEEGVLRSHMLMPHNRRRDSVFFSILKHEWPAVSTRRVFDTVVTPRSRA